MPTKTAVGLGLSGKVVFCTVVWAIGSVVLAGALLMVSLALILPLMFEAASGAVSATGVEAVATCSQNIRSLDEKPDRTYKVNPSHRSFIQGAR